MIIIRNLKNGIIFIKYQKKGFQFLANVYLKVGKKLEKKSKKKMYILNRNIK